MTVISSSPTLLQVIPELGSGGAERGCIDVAAGIVNAGGRAIVMSEGGVLERELNRSGAQHIKAPMKGRSPFAIKRNTEMLVNFIRANNVQLIHARSRAPAWSAMWAARTCGIPFVTTFHGYYRINFPGKHRYNSVMAMGDRVICGSNFMVNHIRQVYKVEDERIRMIYRGIDMHKFNPATVTPSRLLAFSEKVGAETDKETILFPGRYSRSKGHEVMIKALQIMNRPNVVCICMGGITSQRHFNRLIRIANRRGVKNSIVFSEHFDDLPAAYKLADVVIQPTVERQETFCRVAGEALAMGCPLVVSNTGALPEVVPASCGWHTPPGDEHELAQAICAALDLTATERETIYDAGQQWAHERFDLNTMVDDTLKVYNELL